MPITNDFGLLLRAARNAIGLRQRDVARLLHIREQSYISRIETGASNPSLAAVEEIAAAIGFRTLLVLVPKDSLKDSPPTEIKAITKSLNEAIDILRQAVTAINRNSGKKK